MGHSPVHYRVETGNCRLVTVFFWCYRWLHQVKHRGLFDLTFVNKVMAPFSSSGVQWANNEFNFWLLLSHSTCMYWKSLLRSSWKRQVYLFSSIFFCFASSLQKKSPVYVFLITISKFIYAVLGKSSFSSLRSTKHCLMLHSTCIISVQLYAKSLKIWTPL